MSWIDLLPKAERDALRDAGRLGATRYEPQKEYRVAHIKIRTPDDPDGWTAKAELEIGHPYIYSSGDVAVEVSWE